MITILITAIIVAVIGIVLWQTKGFKNLREKNRAAEEKEESRVHYSESLPWAKDQIVGIAEQDAKSGEVFGVKINEAVVDPIWKAQVNADNFTATYSDESIKETTEHPPKVRVEIAKCFDYIRENIQFFAVDFWNAGFQIVPKTDDSPVKSIVVNDGRIDIDELQTNFALFPSESALFSNLAKQEFERRAVESSVITHEKLKKFAERLPKVEKFIVGSIKRASGNVAPKKKKFSLKEKEKTILQQELINYLNKDIGLVQLTRVALNNNKLTNLDLETRVVKQYLENLTKSKKNVESLAKTHAKTPTKKVSKGKK